MIIPEEINALVEQHIEERYLATMDAVSTNPELKADIGEMNGLLDACLTAHHAARRYIYLFIERAQRNFYEKGFWAGVEFARELSSTDENSAESE